MFKNLIRLVYLSLLLGGWSLAALSLHVVRTPDKIGLIPKERLGITDTYVDARKWTLADLNNHPVLVKRLLEANKADLFQYLADPNKGDISRQLSGASAQAPAEQNGLLDGLKGMFAPSGRNSQSQSVPPSEAGIDTIKIPLDF
jgi:hypothetical protein